MTPDDGHVDKAQTAARTQSSSASRPPSETGSLFLVHYDEVGVKGKNRPVFEQLLQNAIHFALHGLPCRDVKRLSGRIIVQFGKPLSAEEADEVGRRLGRVMGIANYSSAVRVPTDLQAIGRRMVSDLEGREFTTFKVAVRRSDKSLPYTSEEAARQLGAAVVAVYPRKVDLDRPGLTCFVELLSRETLLCYEKLPGPGGLPLDPRDKVMSMVSGGIDSPVAAFRMMKRGCLPSFIHFHSAPYTGELSIHKVKELVRSLCAYRCRPALYLIPFATIQRRVVASSHPMFRVLIYRRLMFRIAEALAEREGALALVTGESVGQVASQTLMNLKAIARAVKIPVLRPLVGLDKQEIINQARRIGTYELSIESDADCCSYLMPSNPATHAGIDELDQQERNMPVQSWVREAVEGVEKVVF